MTTDVAKKVSIDIIQENLTNLLTSTLPFKRNLERHFQFMLICLEYHPQPIRQSTAYKRLKKGRKYFQDIILELENADLLTRQNKYYFYIPVHFVRKLTGGVRNPFKKSPQGVGLEDKYLTMLESYNQHALLATYFHDLPVHIWEKYRGHGHWEAEEYSMKRFVFDPYLTYFEDVQFTVKMYKNVIEIYGPAVSEKDSNNRGYKGVTISKTARFAQWFAEKKLSKGKLNVTLKEDKMRFHETNRTFLFQEIANKFYDQGITHVLTNDWGVDFSHTMPEWEAFQNYLMLDREGIGSDLVDEVLYLPRFFVGAYMPYQKQLIVSIQENLDEMRTEQESVNVEHIKNLKLMNENLMLLNENQEKGNRSMENTFVYLETLATKEDVELAREDIQRLSLRLDKPTVKRVFVGLDSKCQKILDKLAEGSLTRTEIALFLGVSDTAPLTQLKKLLSVGEIEEESIHTGKRGRPRKIYKLTGGDKQ